MFWLAHLTQTISYLKGNMSNCQHLRVLWLVLSSIKEQQIRIKIKLSIFKSVTVSLIRQILFFPQPLYWLLSPIHSSAQKKQKQKPSSYLMRTDEFANKPQQTDVFLLLFSIFLAYHKKDQKLLLNNLTFQFRKLFSS